jgi:hypothetical protein
MLRNSPLLEIYKKKGIEVLVLKSKRTHITRKCRTCPFGTGVQERRVVPAETREPWYQPSDEDVAK